MENPSKWPKWLLDRLRKNGITKIRIPVWVTESREAEEREEKASMGTTYSYKIED